MTLQDRGTWRRGTWWLVGALLAGALGLEPLLRVVSPSTAVSVAAIMDQGPDTFVPRPRPRGHDPWGTRWAWAGVLERTPGQPYSAGPNRVREGGAGDDLVPDLGSRFARALARSYEPTLLLAAALSLFTLARTRAERALAGLITALLVAGVSTLPLLRAATPRLAVEADLLHDESIDGRRIFFAGWAIPPRWPLGWEDGQVDPWGQRWRDDCIWSRGELRHHGRFSSGPNGVDEQGGGDDVLPWGGVPYGRTPPPATVWHHVVGWSREGFLGCALVAAAGFLVIRSRRARDGGPDAR